MVLDDVIQLRDETPIIDLVELDDETDLAILEVLGEHDDGLSATQWQMRCKGVVGRSAFRRARARLTAAGLVDNHGTEDRTRFLLTEKGLDVVTSPAPRKVTNNPSQSDHPVNIL